MNRVPGTSDRDEHLVTALVTLSKAVEQLNQRVTRLVKRVRVLETNASANGGPPTEEDE